MRHFVVALALALCAHAPVALAQDLSVSPVPDRHVAISRDVDFPGGDLASFFDTTLDACQATCLADARCTAFTFNQRSGSCFPKGAVGTPTPYQGAISGRVILTPQPILAQADSRAAELSFLGEGDLAVARDLALQIGRYHSSDEFPVGDLLSAATERRNAGDELAAFRYIGAAIALTDRADLWLEYGRLGQTLTSTDSAAQSQARSRALAALTNAYLRTPDPELRATILFDMATALESQSRGRDMIPALRLAQDLAPRRDAEAALDRAIGLYGCRGADTQVDRDSCSTCIPLVTSKPCALNARDSSLPRKTTVFATSSTVGKQCSGSPPCSARASAIDPRNSPAVVPGAACRSPSIAAKT